MVNNRLPNQTSADDMALLRSLIGDAAVRPERLPISFTYDGAAYRGLPETAAVSRQFIDASLVRTVFSADLGKGLCLSAECLAYRDYPVIEWLVWFRNQGDRPTPLISEVSAIDFFIKGEQAVLTGGNGDFYSANGYTPSVTALTPGTVWTQKPTDGRSCNEAYPYQRLMFEGYGLNIAIGWPGEWISRYEGRAGGVAFKAGQNVVHTLLEPGESLRTPRITLMVFAGDAIRGINVWRRWFNAHILPRQYGQPLAGKRICMESGGGIEFTEATEENQLQALDQIKDCGITCDLWWIDAGWYPCFVRPGVKEWPHTGTWEADRSHFPAGLAPIGRKCAELGIDFLLWCEPERVRPGTWLAQHHPEWLLQTDPPGANLMLNLGDPECLRWLCGHFDGLIKEYGVKCYRQDFNFPPVRYWRDNEAPDRAGIIENKYVQGYLAYWDYLLLNNPDLFIDSCASGGRRNDLESLRRAVPLHHTDYGYGNHPLNQAFHHTLNSWAPYYRGFMLSWDDENGSYDHPEKPIDDQRMLDNFMIVNSICPAMNIGNPNELIKMPEKLAYLKSMLAIWQKASPLMIHADFYALTPNHRDSTRWTVFQFDDPERGSGLFQVIRNNACADAAITVAPFGFPDGDEYLLENPESGESYRRTGAAVHVGGLTFEQPLRSGAIWFYRKT